LLLDAADPSQLSSACRRCSTVLSALSYRFNPLVAQVALDTGASYFDLTEDVETAHQVRDIAAHAASGQIFMPQCGLAPGFISVLAYHLTTSFDALESVHLRVGALPQYPSNALKYNLTWSTDGLINEYCNPCQTIHRGHRLDALPLEGVEHLSIDGVEYEAFNTSGGLGSLCDTLEGQVRELNYRTIRYVGHRDLAAFLVNDLRLGQRRELLKDILEQAVPVTFQDVVVIFCTVTGRQEGLLVQRSDARKIYPATVDGQSWSAIQMTTAAGVCAALDLHLAGKLPSSGLVKQEDVDFEQFMENRYGQYYHTQGQADWSPAAADTEREEDGSSVAPRPRSASRTG
jgi:saccharopine dehydrogenase-like NADP-dependent oxidoreductase